MVLASALSISKVLCSWLVPVLFQAGFCIVSGWFLRLVPVLFLAGFWLVIMFQAGFWLVLRSIIIFRAGF
jgi:uncharacterized membrane protein YciS (DUF1049 family)